MRRSLIIISAVLALVSAASAAEKVANPAYKAWAPYKVGSWSKVTGAMKSKAAEAGERTRTMTMTRKLVELTPEKAVVETTMTMNMDGQDRTMPGRKVEIPATVDADKADQAVFMSNTGANVTDVKQGDEEITVLGKSVKCRCYQATLSQAGRTMQLKAWTSTEIPGGLVQTETKLESVDSTLKLDSYEAAK